MNQNIISIFFSFLSCAALVLLFIIKLRFPKGKNIHYIIETRYGRPLLNLFRKFENLDFKIRKNLCDIEFLEVCLENNLTPKSQNYLNKFSSVSACLGAPGTAGLPHLLVGFQRARGHHSDPETQEEPLQTLHLLPLHQCARCCCHSLHWLHVLVHQVCPNTIFTSFTEFP